MRKRKKFEMPRLAITEILMNESIASDCCYSETVTPLITKKNILNGGMINTYTYYQVYSQVVQYFGGLMTAPSTHYTYYAPTIQNPAEYSDAATWISGGLYYKTYDVASFTQNTGHTLSSLYIIEDGQISNRPIDIGGFVQPSYTNCDHMTRSCPFNELVTLKDAHIGAKTPHRLGGVNWQTPHKAAQYNS